MLLIHAALAAGQQVDALAAAASSGDWPRTEALARAAILKDRRDVAAWTYLGLAQDHEGVRGEALHDFAEAARLAPTSTFTHNNYGASLEANGKSAEAEEQYRRSLALDGNQPAALVNLARLALAREGTGAQDEARHLLQRAWQIAPDSEMARSLLVLAGCAQGTEPAPVPDETVRPYGDALAASPTSVPVVSRAQVSRALLACGLKQDAVSFASALLAADPQSAEAVVGKAQAERAEARDADAGRTLESAVARGMESAMVYAELAQVYEATGHMNNAVEAMRRALGLSPQDTALQFQYGMLLLDAHAPKAAELRMSEALERLPQAARLWFVLGLAQFDQTQPAEAQVSFDHALALNPRFAPALAYRGLVALDQQHYNEAEAWYRKAIAADPHRGDLHLLLAEALEREHPEGTPAIREELERAVSLDPNLASAYLRLGRLDLESGKPEQARVLLDKTLKLDPKLLQAHFYLARVYRQLNDPAQAAAESKLFSEQQASADAADRAALQDLARQLAHTAF